MGWLSKECIKQFWLLCIISIIVHCITFAFTFIADKSSQNRTGLLGNMCSTVLLLHGVYANEETNIYACRHIGVCGCVFIFCTFMANDSVLIAITPAFD